MSMNVSINILFVAHLRHHMPLLWGRKFFRQFFHLPLTGLTMTSVSAGHIILTPTQPVGSGRPQRESNPGPLHQKSGAPPPPPPPPLSRAYKPYIVNETFKAVFIYKNAPRSFIVAEDMKR